MHRLKRPCVFNHLLETTIVVGRSSQDNGLDKECLVAMVFLESPDDAEPPTARMVSTQHDLMTTVEVAVGRT